MDNRRKKNYSKDIDSFLSLLSPKKDERILDVGAGLGTVANILANRSDEVFALEPNEKRVAYIKSKHPEVKVFSSKASQIPFPSSYFDKLYAIAAFHHFSDHDDALEEFRRVIKIGGNLLIHEFDPSDGRGKRLRFFETRLLHNNAHFVDKEGLKGMLLGHEFSIIEERKASKGYFVLSKNTKLADDDSSTSI